MGNNTFVDTTKAKPPAPPSDEQIRQELENERRLRQQAENDREQLRLAAQTEWRGRTTAEQELNRLRTPPPPDPFRVLADEGVTVPPDKQQELLDRGVRMRTRQEMSAYDEARRREEAQKDKDREIRNSLTIFAALNPTIVNDQEAFYGAMGKAQFRMEQEKLRLDHAGLLELGKQIYLEDRKAKGQEMPAQYPFTESASPGSVRGGRVEEQEPQPTAIEEYYGLEPGTIRPDSELEEHTKTYIDSRNLELVDKEKFGSRVRQVAATIREGLKRRAANAGR